MAQFTNDQGQLLSLGTNQLGQQGQMGPTRSMTSPGGANYSPSSTQLRTPYQNQLLAQQQGDMARQYSNLNRTASHFQGMRNRRNALEDRNYMVERRGIEDAFKDEMMRMQLAAMKRRAGGLGSQNRGRTSGLFSRNYTPQTRSSLGTKSPDLEYI